MILLAVSIDAFSYGKWSQNFHSYYQVNFIDEAGGKLFVGTSALEVVVSTNQGKTWAPLTSLNEINHHNVFSCMGVLGSNLFVGTSGDGLYRSTDNGETWAFVKNLPDFLVVESIVIKGTKVFMSTSDGVYVSTDNGNQWAKAHTEKLPCNFLCMAVSGDYIFAGTYKDGVYCSTDDGATWNQVNNGIYSFRINSLAANGSTVIAGSDAGGVYRSANNGESWQQVTPNMRINSVAFSGTNAYAGSGKNGLYVSTDNGENWSEGNNGFRSQDIEIVAALGSGIYAGTFSNGLYRLTNTGTWVDLTSGLDYYPIGIATFGQEVFAYASYEGLFKSSDNGNSWSKLNTEFPRNGLSKLGSNSSFLYLTTDLGGIMMSSDKGGSWQRIKDDYPDVFTRIESINATDSEVIFGLNNGNMLITTDNGTNWTTKNIGFKANIDRVLRNSTKLFVLSFQPMCQGISASTDSGDSWSKLDVGVPDSVIRCFAISGDNIFVGTWGEGVFISTDNGTNWHQANNGLADKFVRCISIECSNVFVGTNSGVFTSSLSCSQWLDYNTGLPFCKEIDYLIFNDTHVFVSSYCLGISASEYSCSGVNGVDESNAIDFNIELSPNPSSGTVKIVTKTPFEIDRISISNSIGMVMKEYSGASFGNGNEIELTLDELASGNYFLTLSSNGRKATKRLVLIK